MFLLLTYSPLKAFILYDENKCASSITYAEIANSPTGLLKRTFQ